MCKQVVGHPVVLMEDSSWCELLRYTAARGAYRGAGAQLVAHLARQDVGGGAGRTYGDMFGPAGLEGQCSFPSPSPSLTPLIIPMAGGWSIWLCVGVTHTGRGRAGDGLFCCWGGMGHMAAGVSLGLVMGHLAVGVSVGVVMGHLAVSGPVGVVMARLAVSGCIWGW